MVVQNAGAELVTKIPCASIPAHALPLWTMKVGLKYFAAIEESGSI